METPKIKVRQTAEERVEKQRKYMRDYKRKKYAENSDIKDMNKTYYYKYKFNVPDEDIKRYGVLLPSIYKIKKELDSLKTNNPDILREIIFSYLEENSIKELSTNI